MNRKKILWVLVLVLVAAGWVGYRLYSERGDKGLTEGENPSAEEYGEERKEPEQDRERRADDEAHGALAEVTVRYLGHSCFLLETGDLSILLDPFSPQTGYAELQVEADIVTVSHEHMDHNYVAAAPGARVIRGLTPDGLGWEEVSVSLGEVTVWGLPTYHDGAGGRFRGRNMVFVFDLGELRLVHLGDLGHPLNENQLDQLSPVHVLFIPVGGHYTIDHEEAIKIMEQLSPAVAVPMHYQTKATRNWPISDLKPLLEGESRVRKVEQDTVAINRLSLPHTTEIWIMEPVMLQDSDS